MLTDWRGNEIKVGATVVYPSRAGSGLWMNEGKVESITMVPRKYGYGSTETTLEPKVAVSRTQSTAFRSGPGERLSYPDPERLTVVG